MKTPKTTTKAKSQPIELSSVLNTIPATTGIEQLRLMHKGIGIIPATAVDVLSELDRLAELFGHQSLSVLDLVRSQAHVLQMATGVEASALMQYHPSTVADRLHTVRNLIVAVAAAAAATITSGSPHTSPAAVYANSIKLARRSHHVRRPFTDDEIVLCRVAAHLAARDNSRDHVATTYALIDSGLVPGETTHVRPDDFDDCELPQFVLAAGNGHLQARFVFLDRFTSHTVGRHLEAAGRAGLSSNAPLVYNGRTNQSGSSSATASAQRKIDRFFEQLRLPTGDITASSITQWRVATVLNTQGPAAAQTLSGRSGLAQMYRALGEYGPRAQRSQPDDDGLSFSAAA